MGYERPGERYYPTAATKAVNHGLPCVEEGMAGVAIKQQAAPFGTGLGATEITQIGIGEDFVIDTKGIVQVPKAAISGAVKGDPVYIVAATNALTLTAGSNPKFGRVVELSGERGTPSTKLRINLDAKDSF